MSFLTLCSVFCFSGAFWNRPGWHEYSWSRSVCHRVWGGFAEAGRGRRDPDQVL